MAYEGDLTDTAAFELLQGPFDALVRRGARPRFRNLAGVGRIYLQDGLVRRVRLKAGGGFGYYDDDENVSRKGVCALEVQADFTKIGETDAVVLKVMLAPGEVGDLQASTGFITWPCTSVSRRSMPLW